MNTLDRLNISLLCTVAIEPAAAATSLVEGSGKESGKGGDRGQW